MPCTVLNFAIARNDGADLITGLLKGAKMILHIVQVRIAYYQNHSDSHIEGAIHLVLLDSTLPLEVRKDGEDRPASLGNPGGCPRREDARQVFGDPAPGDMSHPLQPPSIDQWLNQTVITA